ncbi:hypothetical protein K1719_012593 [Acacia pycnantha]|nr:hypothetical protein K1719_012593 [Acacia pycnantha]
MPNLLTLDLSQNHDLTTSCLQLFRQRWEKIEVINLRENKVQGKLLTSLGNVTSLTRLHLDSNAIEGGFPSSIAKLCNSNRFSSSRNNMIGNLREILEGTQSCPFKKPLHNLNLSRNQITGNIPESISNMSQLSSLDLSSNQLTGSITRSLSSLSFLGYLNLSHNNLSGAISYTGHMTTFESSSFVGNPDLYGCPLPVRSLHHGDGHVVNGSNKGTSNDNEANDSDGFIDKWFYLSLGLGFAAGLLIPFLILAMRRSWSDAYYDFVEVVIVKFLVLMRRRRINLGRRIKPRRRQ